MDAVINALVQEIEEAAFPHFFALSEYRRSQSHAMEHAQWLEEHLTDEAQNHLERLRAADLSMDALEREAMVRAALTAGIRLALTC